MGIKKSQEIHKKGGPGTRSRLARRPSILGVRRRTAVFTLAVYAMTAGYPMQPGVA